VDLLERDLRDLGRVPAPDDFAERVLAAAGIRSLAADSYAEIETPIGVFHVAWNLDGVCALRRAEAGFEFERWFLDRFGRPVIRSADLPARLGRQLADQVSGRGRSRVRFDLRRLTDFERDVLLKTLEIPRGEVRTYAWVAREIGRPRAVRAVGTALGHNPIPILIPCHRVIRSNGGLGEYSGGGPESKRAILGAEGVDADWLEELSEQGVRFIGSRTTHVFCMPTCRNARRILTANRVPFADERSALAAGFRPCAHCRPSAEAVDAG
jgi:O-6-methylguanine DNA methyltransferase